MNKQLEHVFYCPNCTHVQLIEPGMKMDSCCPDRAPIATTRQIAEQATIGFRSAPRPATDEGRHERIKFYERVLADKANHPPMAMELAFLRHRVDELLESNREFMRQAAPGKKIELTIDGQNYAFSAAGGAGTAGVLSKREVQAMEQRRVGSDEPVRTKVLTKEQMGTRLPASELPKFHIPPAPTKAPDLDFVFFDGTPAGAQSVCKWANAYPPIGNDEDEENASYVQSWNEVQLTLAISEGDKADDITVPRNSWIIRHNENFILLTQSAATTPVIADNRRGELAAQVLTGHGWTLPPGAQTWMPPIGEAPHEGFEEYLQRHSAGDAPQITNWEAISRAPVTKAADLRKVLLRVWEDSRIARRRTL